MTSLEKAVAKMARNPRGVRFEELVKVCEHYFGAPRISGSHRFFTTPWEGKPLVNIQPDGHLAKAYQVRQVLEAIAKAEAREG